MALKLRAKAHRVLKREAIRATRRIIKDVLTEYGLGEISATIPPRLAGIWSSCDGLQNGLLLHPRLSRADPLLPQSDWGIYKHPLTRCEPYAVTDCIDDRKVDVERVTTNARVCHDRRSRFRRPLRCVLELQCRCIPMTPIRQAFFTERRSGRCVQARFVSSGVNNHTFSFDSQLFTIPCDPRRDWERRALALSHSHCLLCPVLCMPSYPIFIEPIMAAKPQLRLVPPHATRRSKRNPSSSSKTHTFFLH
jgi:hypothetical protein